MQVISNALYLKDFIRDIAAQFKSNAQSDCSEHLVILPPHIGEGTISGADFKDGLGILFFDCTFHKDTEFVFEGDAVKPAKFIFCRKGEFIHSFEELDRQELIEKYQNIIFSGVYGKSYKLIYKAGVAVKTNTLHVNRSLLTEDLNCQIGKLPEELKSLLSDTEAENYFFRRGNYGMGTTSSFFELEKHKEPCFERDLLIHRECYGIFYKQIREYKALEAAEIRNLEIENREVRQIHEAAKIIEDTLANFKTVRDLAYKVGLNPNKLQAGFKSIHGKTVNDYIQDIRIDRALVLIRNTDLTFSEIADEVGIKSKSYFSKILKDKYGYTPTQIRKRLQRQNQLV